MIASVNGPSALQNISAAPVKSRIVQKSGVEHRHDEERRRQEGVERARRPEARQPVREADERRRHQDADDERQREDDADLARPEILGSEPDRKERHVDAVREEHRRGERRGADGVDASSAARHHS